MQRGHPRKVGVQSLKRPETERCVKALIHTLVSALCKFTHVGKTQIPVLDQFGDILQTLLDRNPLK